MPYLHWNTDLSFWKKIDNKIINEDWDFIKLNYDSKDFVTDERGIYMIAVSTNHFSKIKPFDDLFTPIYVGKAINLKNRFKDHSARGRENNKLKELGFFSTNSIFYYKVLPGLTETELFYHEQTLIDVFGGSLNKTNSVSEKRKLTIKAQIMKEKKHGT